MQFTIEERLNHLKDWCNGSMIGNLMNKYSFEVVDKAVYKNGEVSEDHKRIFHVSPIYGKGFGKLKPQDKAIHNIEIRYPRYCPQVTFEQYLAKQCRAIESDMLFKFNYWKPKIF